MEKGTSLRRYVCVVFLTCSCDFSQRTGLSWSLLVFLALALDCLGAGEFLLRALSQTRPTLELPHIPRVCSAGSDLHCLFTVLHQLTKDWYLMPLRAAEGYLL